MTPQLNRTDAWFIAALTDARKGAKAMSLWQFANNADWVNREIPTFDEVRFAFPRLAAAGYLTVSRDRDGRLTLKATDKAFELRSRVRARTLGDALSGFAELVGARPFPDAEEEDRSLGPLEGFEPAEWEAAVARNAAWMDRWSRPLVAAARLLSRRQPRG